MNYSYNPNSSNIFLKPSAFSFASSSVISSDISLKYAGSDNKSISVCCNSNFRISKSKKDEVLQELINDSFLVRNNESVRSFIEWVKKVEFYDIIYSNEKDVLDFIKKI